MQAPSGSQSRPPVRDSHSRELPGLWKRNGRFYVQMHIHGKGCRRVALLDENNDPVASVDAARVAMSRVLLERSEGRPPAPRRTPFLPDYIIHYLSWMNATKAKSPLTIEKESFTLTFWARTLGRIRLTDITPRMLHDVALRRTQAGVSNRTVNLDVLILNNLLKFARREGCFKGRLPTEDWVPLKHVPPRRMLLSCEQIQALCDEATALEKCGAYRRLKNDFLAFPPKQRSGGE